MDENTEKLMDAHMNKNTFDPANTVLAVSTLHVDAMNSGQRELLEKVLRGVREYIDMTLACIVEPEQTRRFGEMYSTMMSKSVSYEIAFMIEAWITGGITQLAKAQDEAYSWYETHPEFQREHSGAKENSSEWAKRVVEEMAELFDTKPQPEEEN